MKYQIKYIMENGTQYSLKPITEIVTNLEVAKLNIACMPSVKILSIKELV